MKYSSLKESLFNSKQLILIVTASVAGMSVLSYVILGAEFRVADILLLALCVTGSLFSLRKYDGDYLAPGFYFPIAYYLFYWIGNFDFLDMYPDVPDYIWTYYLIGGCGFFCGLFIVNHIIPRISGVTPAVRSEITVRGRNLAVLLFCICVVAKILMYVINGIPLFSSNIEGTREGASENFGALKVLTTMLVVFPPYFFYDFAIKKHKNPVDIAVIVACLLFAILDTSRLLILQIIAPIVILYIIKIKKIKLRTVLIIVGCGLVFLGANKFIRNALSDPMYLSYISQTRSTGLIGNILLSGFDSFRVGIEGFRAIVSVVPSQYDFTHGMMFLNSLLSPLPGKQETIGFYAASLLGLEFDGIGMATTILGMFYLDGGVLGIAIGMLLFGGLLEFNYKMNIVNGRVGPHNLFPIYLVYYSVVALRTGVLPTIEPVLMLVLYWLIGRMMTASYKSNGLTIYEDSDF